MWNTRAIAVFLMTLCVVAAGCMPRVVVHSRPGPDDPGIRYYRPKPYLKIEPAEVAINSKTSAVTPGVVRISVVYLPDFSEEYSIDVRSGFGVADVSIKLEDGWNLTEISQDLDSQTDENIESISRLITAVGSAATSGGGTQTDEAVTLTLPARNVPLGLYEAVLGRDARGCKRLYGFRYVGFLPFSPCPTDMTGHEVGVCGDPCQMLYGLIFDRGEMVFAPLNDIATTPVGNSPAAAMQTDASVGQSLPPIVEPVDLGLESIEPEIIAMELRRALRSQYESVVAVEVDRHDHLLRVWLIMASGDNADEVRFAAEDLLRRNYPRVPVRVSTRVDS